MFPGKETKLHSALVQGTLSLLTDMSSITTSAFETSSRRSIEQTCDDIALAVLAVVAIVAGLTFRDYGLGWDDYTHAEYADLLLKMFRSGFTDTSALTFANLYMYGGGFDMPRLSCIKLFRSNCSRPGACSARLSASSASA